MCVESLFQFLLFNLKLTLEFMLHQDKTADGQDQRLLVAFVIFF